MKQIRVREEEAGQRLDRLLSRYLKEAPKSFLYKMMRKKNITLNGKKADGGAVKNVDLWKRLLKAMEPHQVQFVWVKGHDGHPENERCDALATGAADGEDLLDDTGL